MSTMTTQQRGNPALAIAPTQNTAPVYEFNCLYTNDLRKKKKTWHDGSLRFHTFNRRVMVYDESKNYIGDLHYREAEDLQEGEDLKLDKGVLVEVGERIGKTDTDLTPILDKGRTEDDNREVRCQPTPHSIAQRMFALPTKGRPKSIAAVLGASQGPMGRARVTVQSPYEQLHHIRPDMVPNEPPSKRQRSLTGKENAMVAPKQMDHQKQLDSRQRPLSSTRTTFKVPLAMAENSFSQNVIDIPSEDESDPLSLFSSLGEPSTGRKVQHTILVDPRPQKPAHEMQLKRMEKPQLKAASAFDTLTVIPESGKQPNAPAVAPPSSRLRLSLAGTTSNLRFAPEQPRKKIMYIALLPSPVGCDTTRTSTSARDISIEPRNRAQNLQARLDVLKVQKLADVNEDESIFDFDIPDTFDSQGEAAAVVVGKKNVQRDSRDQGSSPLFFGQSTSFLEQEDAGDVSEGDIVVDSLEKDISMDILFKAQTKSPPPEHPTTHQRASLDESCNHAQTAGRPPLVSNLTLMDQRLMMPPPQLQKQVLPATVSPQPRLFRRVLSENDSPAHTTTKAVMSAMSRVPNALGGLQPRERTSPTLLPFKSPKKLQRASSDTATMLHPSRFAPAQVNVPANIQEEEDTDVGPWSTKEAFLLFDWWPPGREKPNYAEVSENRGRILHDEDDL